jgi:hypothetical protein
VSVQKRVWLPPAQPLYLLVLPAAKTRVALDDLGDGTVVDAQATSAPSVVNLTM